MTFSRTVCLIAVVIGSSFSKAADSPAPVADMFINGMERHEFALVSNAALRCGSLYLLMSAILTRDTNDSDTAKALEEQAKNYSIMGLYTAAALRKRRGVDVNVDEIQERVVLQSKLFTELYGARMKSNQASTGEMWGSDELIKGDIEFCKMVGVLSSDEWAKTLTSNNWDYWDETFKNL
jgi:hypothetical protein